MEQQVAINVLLQVAQLAQSRGILKLEETEIVLAAVRALTPKEVKNGEEITE